MKTPLLLLALVFTGLACAGPPASAPANPVELGTVHWVRNFDEADAEARRRGVPLLLLFQEVPG